MRANTMAVGGLAILLASAWVLPVIAQEEKKAEKSEKAEKKSEEPAKAKAEKVSGDIGLGSSAVVQYTKDGEKNIATNVEYVPAKGE